MKALTLEEAAIQLGATLSAVKEAKASLKRGKHWTVGRYNKPYVNAAGMAKLKEILAPMEEQEPEQVLESEPVEVVPVFLDPVEEQIIEVKPNATNALERLLAENDTAVVVATRFPNRRMLRVKYGEEERWCQCKDSRYFVPGMVIPVRQDGEHLVAKLQPRRLGKF